MKGLFIFNDDLVKLKRMIEIDYHNDKFSYSVLATTDFCCLQPLLD